MSKEINEDDILQKITDTPNLLSALYDADLLPEQTAHEPDLYRRTLVIAALWPNRRVPDPKIAALEARSAALEAQVRGLQEENSILRGLRQKATVDRGSFAQYATETIVTSEATRTALAEARGEEER